MSVLIRGMEMPKSCKECQVSFGYGNDVYCPFLFEPCDAIEDELMWKECPKEGKLADCPLVEIPPHGRLIDADAFDERVRVAGGMSEEELTEDFKDGVQTVLYMLSKQQPIIEAEGREE